MRFNKDKVNIIFKSVYIITLIVLLSHLPKIAAFAESYIGKASQIQSTTSSKNVQADITRIDASVANSTSEILAIQNNLGTHELALGSLRLDISTLEILVLANKANLDTHELLLNAKLDITALTTHENLLTAHGLPSRAGNGAKYLYLTTDENNLIWSPLVMPDLSPYATLEYVNGTDEALSLAISLLPTKEYVNITDENILEAVALKQSIADMVNYYTKTSIDLLLNDKANTGEVALKANSADVYSKASVDLMLTDKANTGAVALKQNISDMVNYYTKTAIDTLLNDKANTGEVALKQSIADMVNYYTITATDILLSGKASTDSVALKQDISDMVNYYTKTAMDLLLSDKAGTDAVALKANSSDVYTKTSVDLMLTDKANTGDVALKQNISDMINYYTKTAVDLLLTGKADTDSVYTKTAADLLFATISNLGLKANSTDVYTKAQADSTMEAYILPINIKLDSVEAYLLSLLPLPTEAGYLYYDTTEAKVIWKMISAETPGVTDHYDLAHKGTLTHDQLEASLLTKASTLEVSAKADISYVDTTVEAQITYVNGLLNNVIMPTYSWMQSSDVCGITAAGILGFSGITFTISEYHAYMIQLMTFSSFDPESIDISDVTGHHYIWFDATGLLGTSVGDAWGGMEDFVVKVATVYYNAEKTTTPKYIMFNEQHDVSMPSAVHKYLHTTIGAKSPDLFVLYSYSLKPSSPSNAGNQFAMNGGTLYDEDLATIIPTHQDGVAPPIMWREGSAGNWTWTSMPTVPLLYGTYMKYNQYTGTTWTTTEVAANKYVNMFTVVTNAVDATYSVILIPGQTVHSSLAAAQAETAQSLILGDFPVQECIFTNKITFSTGSSYSSSGKCRIEAVENLYGINIRLGNVSITNHNALAGRTDPNSHPATAISSTNGDVQTDITNLFSNKADTDSVYTKSAMDILLALKASVAYVNGTDEASIIRMGSIEVALNNFINATAPSIYATITNLGIMNSRVNNLETYAGQATAEIVALHANDTTLETLINSKAPAVAPKAVKSTCLYYGYPIAINDLWNEDKAAEFYSKYDIIVFGDGYQQTSHETHLSTVDIITKIKVLNPDVEIFGYVPIGGSLGRNLTTEEIETGVDEWKATGATGIFFDEFGFDYMVTRERQNMAVDKAHSLSMTAMANAWTIDHVFNNDNGYCDWIPFYGNPNFVEAHINANDYYVFENLFYYYDGSQKVEDQWRVYEAYRYYYDSATQSTYGVNYYETFGTKTLGLDGVDVSYASRDKAYATALLGARALNLDAYCVSPINWGADSTIYPNYSFSLFPEEKKMFENTTKIQPLVETYNGDDIAKYTTTIENNIITLYWEPGGTIPNPALGTHKAQINGVDRTNSYTPSAASSSNAIGNLVLRDSSGNFSAGTITGTLNGNATTASTLATPRTINGVPFDGSANITLPIPESGITNIYGGSSDVSGTGTGEVTFKEGSNVTIVRTGSTIEISATGGSSSGGKADETTAVYVSSNIFDFPATYDTTAIILFRNGVMQPRRLFSTSTVDSKTRVIFATTVDASDEIILYSAK